MRVAGFERDLMWAKEYVTSNDNFDDCKPKTMIEPYIFAIFPWNDKTKTRTQ